MACMTHSTSISKFMLLMIMVIMDTPGLVIGMLGRNEVGGVRGRLVGMLVGKVEIKLVGSRAVGKLMGRT